MYCFIAVRGACVHATVPRLHPLFHQLKCDAKVAVTNEKSGNTAASLSSENPTRNQDTLLVPSLQHSTYMCMHLFICLCSSITSSTSVEMNHLLTAHASERPTPLVLESWTPLVLESRLGWNHLVTADACDESRPTPLPMDHRGVLGAPNQDDCHNP